MNRSTQRGLFAALILVALAAPGWSQLQTGNLFGSVADEQGQALAGVTVTLSGGGAPQIQVTSALGEFRFPGQSPGSYQVKAELEGFSTVEYPNVVINVGRNTTVAITLSGAVEDVITVTAESPLLDERRISTGNTVSQTELEKIPTARDPWAILQSTPGVLTDRINVGGNESGQQSAYVGPGSAGDQSVWSVDGVVITDMAALGSTPAYFDFDSFEEMQVTTGGSDSTIATGGVVLNIVTKRGTNEWRATGRYLMADQDWQSSFDPDDPLGRKFDAASTDQPPFKQGNRIVDVKDYGVEAGGPIIKDRLWIWGSYGRQKVDLLTVSDFSDFTDLETMNAKVNAQLASNNSASLSALNSDKVKIGRNAGPTRPQLTTWNQSKFSFNSGYGPNKEDPTTAKLEDTHIFSSNFYLTGMYSFVNGGFALIPQGGFTASSPRASLDENFIWQNNFVGYQIGRPQEQFKADASTFFNTGNLSHELKFGAGYREAETETLSRWPGQGLQYDFYKSIGYNFNYVGLTRDGQANVLADYTSVYVQDTLSVGNLTANAGIRYDQQGGEFGPTSVGANTLIPDLLPAASFSGGDIGFEWEDIVPRLGLTYALGAERKTLLRASYSRFADQLGVGNLVTLNPLYGPTYVYFYYDDLNGNGQADGNELVPGIRFTSANWNPVTGGTIVANAVDPNLSAPQTDELLFSVEHSLLPEFVVGLNVTFRQVTDILENERLVYDCATAACADALAIAGNVGRKHQRSDYVATQVTRTIPDGSTRTITLYNLKPGVRSRNGVFLENGDREQEYTGVSATFNKRLANRWMMRGNFTWSDWTWKTPQSELEDGSPYLNRAFDGDPVLQGSGNGSGSKGAVYINSEWSYSLNGMYQVAPDRPWGFNLAANLTGRQGYPLPYFRREGRTGGVAGTANQSMQYVGQDEFRLDDVHVLDLRLEKEFNFSEIGLTVGVDCFNALNAGTTLQRQHRLNLAASNHITEVLSPQIFRVGARISFR